MKPAPNPFSPGSSYTREARKKGNQLFTSEHTELEREFWLIQASWELDEAVAISLGRDPRDVNWPIVEPYSGSSSHAYEYEKRWVTVMRAREQGLLLDPVAPADFIRWATSLGLYCAVAEDELPCPPAPGSEPAPSRPPHSVEHSAAVPPKTNSKRQDARRSEEELSNAWEDRELNPQERRSLLTLLYGMSRHSYEYDPSKKKSSTVSLIQTALETNGVRLDRKTIKKYLEEADSLVQELNTF
jgi:hypothetical protein